MLLLSRAIPLFLQEDNPLTDPRMRISRTGLFKNRFSRFTTYSSLPARWNLQLLSDSITLPINSTVVSGLGAVS